MEKENNDLNLRSEEIQDIMQRTPSWIIRWGITTVFLIIFSSLFLTWFIKYPEIISGTAKLTTVIPPTKIISQSSGKMTFLFVKDGDEVKAGDVLAEIENPLSVEGIKYIEGYIKILDQALAEKKSQLPIPNNTSMSLGDLQSVFNDLQKELLAFNLNKTYKIDDLEIAELNQHIADRKSVV